jgi:hypothetical protein
MLQDERLSHSGNDTSLDRRAFVGLGAVTFMGVLPAAVYAQPSTPAPDATAEATPEVDVAIDTDALLELSILLTGVDALPEGGVEPLAGLISADQAYVSAFEELSAGAQVDESGRLPDVSEDAQNLADNIIAFWYTGMFDGLPAPDREERYFQLLAWQTVPYTTILTVCKNFGYWAEDVPVTFE